MDFQDCWTPSRGGGAGGSGGSGGSGGGGGGDPGPRTIKARAGVTASSSSSVHLSTPHPKAGVSARILLLLLLLLLILLILPLRHLLFVDGNGGGDGGGDVLLLAIRDARHADDDRQPLPLPPAIVRGPVTWPRLTGARGHVRRADARCTSRRSPALIYFYFFGPAAPGVWGLGGGVTGMGVGESSADDEDRDRRPDPIVRR
jgi:hypothetical protein